MNFVCTVFEQGDEMLTLLSMEKQWWNATIYIYRYIVKFHLSSWVVYAEKFQIIFHIHKIYSRFTGQSVLINGKLTPEGGNRSKFPISIFLRGGSGGNPIIWQHDTLRWKTERSAKTNTKCCWPSKQLTEVSTRSQAVGLLNVKIPSNVISLLKC